MFGLALQHLSAITQAGKNGTEDAAAQPMTCCMCWPLMTALGPWLGMPLALHWPLSFERSHLTWI
jgi:hypothetical protein